MQIATAAKKKNLISLTPLIDIVFILLVFFMLVTNFTRYSYISMNISQDESDNIEIKSSSIIGLSATGEIHHDYKETTLGSLEEIINNKLMNNSHHMFFVKPSSKSKLDDTLAVIDLISIYAPENFTLLQDEMGM